MTTTKSVKITLVYEDATSRIYTFNGVENENLPDVKNKIKAINASLTAGTANDFATTFVSDNGRPCKMISKGQIISITQEVLYSAS